MYDSFSQKKRIPEEIERMFEKPARVIKRLPGYAKTIVYS
jgi:hypothetical protein